MLDRRQFLKLTSSGVGAVFASALPGFAHAASTAPSGAYEDFYFVQMSDAHWGYSGPANPQSKTTLANAVEAVNALTVQPDFIVFTGDLTHTTDDPVERRRRMTEFKEIVSHLKVKEVRFLAGEHDASLDSGTAFREIFGETHYTFDHKGVHFIALDNVSDPGAQLGSEQILWLKTDLAKQAPEVPVVVLTHRPLFDLAPAWDWATRDGAAAIDILATHPNVTVFYGHIHQEHHFMTGTTAHHSAKSLIFPLPVVGSQEKRTPLPWDPSAPLKGLGVREIKAQPSQSHYQLSEYPLLKS
jgi:3',5'-cyclic AMP phosphodiesterase CpdA